MAASRKSTTKPRAGSTTRRARSAPARRVPVDQSLMQNLVGYNIRRAELHMRQAFDDSVGKSGLRPSEYSILVLIDTNPLATQADLGRALNIRRPNMVVLIDRLEHRGLLARTEHGQDGRMRSLRLTAKGSTLLRRAQRLSLDGELRATQCWTAGERAQVVALLRRLYERD